MIAREPIRRRAVSRVASACFLVLGLLAGAAEAGDRVRHEMVIELEPDSHGLKVVDTIHLPEALATPEVEFLLNAAYEIVASQPAVVEVPLGDAADFHGINGSSLELDEDLTLKRYRFASAPGDDGISLTWEGTVDFGLSDQKEEYTRGFRETAGLLGKEGVYLAGSGFWYPYFTDELLEFTVESSVPEGWHVISQGNGESKGADGRARWDSAGPMDEIYLVGGPLIRYADDAGAVQALVYLHEPDDALAAKYLTTTAQYLEMYRDLIGRYPYTKFALVENFWETGYGMPSFTLLGPSIIRFPFILHSSYPHEILHNWWGNSVFVDYESGNWCEGLTAYLADHLVKEQRGQGSDYRRSTLQKYRDYVRDGRDFPLSEFRSRHSAATEAVGYGKTLMGFHMLRRRVGDDAFREALVRLYRTQRGKRASFRDLQAVFEQVSGADLGAFFDAWVDRPGAATLAVALDGVTENAEGFVVRGRLEQIQDGESFPLRVPVVARTSWDEHVTTVELTGPSTAFEIQTTKPPIELAVDPDFDVFRKLDPREIPPSIGQIFGSPEILAVLPAGSEKEEAYRGLMEGWRSDSHAVEIVLDSELEELPSDRSAWILGTGNRFAPSFAEATGGASGGDFSLGGEAVPRQDHSVVVVRRHPASDELALGWIVVEPTAAFDGMSRKLPHYGKYSYLAFQGEEPTNVVKGQWPASDSPLVVDLRSENERGEALAARSPAARTALAELPPVFSRQDLMDHVTYLASPELEGRGVGSRGLEMAAEYVAGKLEEYGYTPGGDDGTFLQRFSVDGPEGNPVEVANVIAYLPGAEEAWADQSFLVSAHYDHLGRGWPDVREGNENTIHPGADDNASGVAVFLELARNFADSNPKRNLVFAAFTAEEAGRLGSEHFVDHPTPFPLEGVRGVINLDTVGRLGDGPVQVLGTGTSEEWQHIFRGSGFVTGVEGKNVPEAAGGSDQMSFIARGIPGVQIFTRAHGDYHAPSDTAEKIDGSGLVKVAVFVKEAIAYMTEREEPLTVTIEGAQATETPEGERPTATTGGRRVRFGTVPDFAFEGPGVRVDSVVPDSPAERAGVEVGDVLRAMDGRELADLQGYSDLLKTLEVGQEVEVTVVRGGEEVTLRAVLEAR